MLGLPIHIITGGEEKLRYVEQLGPASVIAFGNGMNDVGMLRLAAIGGGNSGRRRPGNRRIASCRCVGIWPG